MAKVLDRTPGEIESLEASYTSFWARLLRASLEPWERYGAIESSPEMFGPYPAVTDQFDLPDYLTKEDYLAGTEFCVLLSAHRQLPCDPRARRGHADPCDQAGISCPR